MIQLTMLNTMASSDFSEALDRHNEWGLKQAHRRSEALRAGELVRDHGLSVYCFSTQLFEPDARHRLRPAAKHAGRLFDGRPPRTAKECFASANSPVGWRTDAIRCR